MHVLISGATGFVGRAVVSRFLKEGWAVTALTRDPASARHRLPVEVDALSWDALGAAALSDPRGARFDAVVHLAGESLVRWPWTAARKRAMRASRVSATRRLVEALGRLASPPAVFVSASGMGYHGDAGDRLVRVGDAAGDDFLGTLAQEWEAEARGAEAFGARVASVRLGLVLGTGGGALPRMALPYRLGLGAVLGSGKQYWPWIHREDAAGMFFAAATRGDLRGPMHGAAGRPLTHEEFSRTLASVLGRPQILLPWFRIPAPVLRFAAGEMADLFLHGQRAEPDPRFSFRYDSLTAALTQALRRQNFR